ncbi:FliG C-terminal domain-containing protein [Vibrio penaeicida]|uniref:FliG C-terminal domain-containing protein n=1 Tax=Vibrio penaeicida TaxID=104609 RepID=UPI00142D9EE7|nr:FliG C-terminal domain-containing protein [Vibrio penaeicida]
MMNPLVKLAFILPFCISSFSLAQSSSEIQALEFSARLEARINDDIERIIGPNKHVLTIQSEFVQKENSGINVPVANASAAKTPETKADQTGAPQRTTTIAAPVRRVAEFVPKLPGLSGMPAKENIEIPVQTMAQPAPPPQQNTPAPNPTANISKNQREAKPLSTEINKLSVTLLLDEKVSSENVQLLKKLLIQKVDYNPLRGDSLDIIRTVFEVPNKDSTQIQEKVFWLDYFWLTLIALGLVIITLIVMLLRARSAGPNNDTVNDVQPASSLQAEPLVSHQYYEHEACRQELVKFSLGEPHQVDQTIRKLSLNEQNLPMFACVYQELGRAMFTTMYPSLTSQIPSYVSYLEQNPNDREQVVKHVSAFKQLLVDSNPHAHSTRKSQPFDFLETLSINQIRWLLEHEPERIQAMVISQLSSENSAALLSLYPMERQAELAMEIARLDTLPMATFNDVASSLATKAQTVPDFRTLPTDGPFVLTQILDGLSITKQNDLLTQLKETSPGAYVQLKQRFYSFDDIWRTPTQIISNHIRNLDAQTLANAFSDMPVERVKALISGCPNRYVNMVISELEMATDVNENDRNAAKQDIVRVMRQALEENKFKMSELEELA